jgi:hypothetical protein
MRLTANRSWEYHGTMKIKCFSSATLISMGLGLLAQISPAQAPSGNITSRTFSGVGEGLYDLTDIVTNLDEEFLGNGDSVNTNTFSENVTLTQSARGALTGGGTTTITVVTPSDFSGSPGTFTFSATYAIKGSVKSAGSNLVVALAFNAQANNVNLGDGVGRTLKESLKYLITIVPSTGTQFGKKSGSASASGRRSIKLLDTTIPERSAPLPVDWNVSLDLSSSGTKVTGTAAANLADGRSFPFTVRGSYNTATGLSTLTLTGAGIAKGGKLAVVLAGSNVTAVTGRLLGQNVNVNGS